MSTGVKLSDDCIPACEALKLKKVGRYVAFKLSDAKDKIEVEEVGDRSVTYADFHSKLPKDSCRYYLFDFEWKDGDRDCAKLIFLNWTPDTSPVKAKMLAAGSKDALRKKLEGVVEVQATDPEEASEAEVRKKL